MATFHIEIEYDTSAGEFVVWSQTPAMPGVAEERADDAAAAVNIVESLLDDYDTHIEGQLS